MGVTEPAPRPDAVVVDDVLVDDVVKAYPRRASSWL
jgi:hypothetical protein